MKLKLIKFVLVFLCFSSICSAETVSPNALDGGTIPANNSAGTIQWQDYDFERLSVFYWNPPIIVNTKTQQRIKKLSEIRFFLYSNFYERESISSAKAEILKTHNLCASLFLCYSAIYAMPATRADETMRFLRDNLPAIEQTANGDPTLKSKAMALRRLISSYFSLGEINDDPQLESITKLLGSKGDEVKAMKSKVISSNDDELKFLYFFCRVAMKDQLLPDEISLLQQLKDSPKISDEVYSTMLAVIELVRNGYSEQGRLLLYYNVESGCLSSALTALILARTSNDISQAAYFSYLLYKNIPYVKGGLGRYLSIILYNFLVKKDYREAFFLWGFMSAGSKDFPELRAKLNEFNKSLESAKSKMSQIEYDIYFKAGERQYTEHHVYECSVFELRSKASILSGEKIRELSRP